MEKIMLHLEIEKSLHEKIGQLSMLSGCPDLGVYIVSCINLAEAVHSNLLAGNDVQIQVSSKKDEFQLSSMVMQSIRENVGQRVH